MTYLFLRPGENITVFIQSGDVCENDCATCGCLWHVGKRVDAYRAQKAAIADRSATAPRRETGVARKGESGGAGTAIAQGQAMNP